MKPLSSHLNRFLRALSLPDILVSTAITGVLAAGMFTGLAVVQRTGSAAAHYSRRQIDQARLTDYVARDLRRALSVKVDTFNGVKRITLTIPDYYDPATGLPREPAISSSGAISYGGSSTSVTVIYYKQNMTLYRSVNGVPTALATDVEDFTPDFVDGGKQIVGISTSFNPKFRWSSPENGALRAGTATYTSTLLRNKRL